MFLNAQKCFPRSARFNLFIDKTLGITRVLNVKPALFLGEHCFPPW